MLLSLIYFYARICATVDFFGCWIISGGIGIGPIISGTVTGSALAGFHEWEPSEA